LGQAHKYDEVVPVIYSWRTFSNITPPAFFILLQHSRRTAYQAGYNILEKNPA
jgi:hypothetical protein